MTEAADLQGSWDASFGTGAGGGMTWANSIYTAVVNANVTGYLYWIGVQGGDTNSKLIRINNGVVNPSKRLWAFANWSRFVRPGAVRVGATGGGGSLRVSAFKNKDGAIAVQFINSGAAATRVSIKVNGATAESAPTTAQGWITDASNDVGTLVATMADGIAGASIPARAMVTIVLRAAATNSR